MKKPNFNNFTIFQWTLIGFMLVGAILDNQKVVLASLFGILIGYLEPIEARRSLMEVM